MRGYFDIDVSARYRSMASDLGALESTGLLRNIFEQTRQLILTTDVLDRHRRKFFARKTVLANARFVDGEERQRLGVPAWAADCRRITFDSTLRCARLRARPAYVLASADSDRGCTSRSNSRLATFDKESERNSQGRGFRFQTQAAKFGTRKLGRLPTAFAHDQDQRALSYFSHLAPHGVRCCRASFPRLGFAQTLGVDGATATHPLKPTPNRLASSRRSVRGSARRQCPN